MIQANELRIGNWVYDSKVMKRNMRVRGHLIQLLEELQEHGGKANGIQPVPLTPEILEKAGFEIVEDANNWHFDQYKIYRVGQLLLGYSGGKFYWYDQVEDDMFSNMFPQLEYVHQLQNLYYALTGTELTIEL